MKKFLLSMLMLACGLTGAVTGANAQSQIYEVQHTNLITGGSFNNGTGTSQKTYAVSALPLYTKLDSITNTGTDTFKAKVVGYYSSLTFQVNLLKISGTDSASVTLWASAESGNGTNFVQLATVGTMTNSSNTQPFSIVVNNAGGGGNPYSNYWLVVKGIGGTEVFSWQGFLLIR